MVDQITASHECPACGATLSNGEFDVSGICHRCAGYDYLSPPPSEATTDAPAAQPSDPDHPPWGPGAGIGVWIASIAAIIVIPVLAVGLWLFIAWVRGAPLPNFADKEELEQWVLSPNILLLQLMATMAAQLVTVALCWAVVTKLGSRPFWATLGSGWGGRPIWYWVAFSACLLVALELLSRVLLRFLPQTDSPFDQMLRVSQSVRITVAVLATFTAPLAEEIVYRGVLFSALRKSIGLTATVPVVTLTFAGVHVFQNRGAWVSMTGLTLLSLALTLVRARTKSVLPCIVIHTFNNAIASLAILLNKGS